MNFLSTLYVPSRIPSTRPTSVLLNLKTILWGYSYTHFTDEETEAPKGPTA